MFLQGIKKDKLHFFFFFPPLKNYNIHCMKIRNKKPFIFKKSTHYVCKVKGLMWNFFFGSFCFNSFLYVFSSYFLKYASSLKLEIVMLVSSWHFVHTKFVRYIFDIFFDIYTFPLIFIFPKEIMK